MLDDCAFVVCLFKEPRTRVTFVRCHIIIRCFLHVIGRKNAALLLPDSTFPPKSPCCCNCRMRVSRMYSAALIITAASTAATSSTIQRVWRSAAPLPPHSRWQNELAQAVARRSGWQVGVRVRRVSVATNVEHGERVTTRTTADGAALLTCRYSTLEDDCSR